LDVAVFDFDLDVGLAEGAFSLDGNEASAKGSAASLGKLAFCRASVSGASITGGTLNLNDPAGEGFILVSVAAVWLELVVGGVTGGVA
jgi:hypothetical protein